MKVTLPCCHRAVNEGIRHTEGLPVGPLRSFLELLRGNFFAEGEVGWRPKNDLGLKYFGLAVEMVYRRHEGPAWLDLVALS